MVRRRWGVATLIELSLRDESGGRLEFGGLVETMFLHLQHGMSFVEGGVDAGGESDRGCSGGGVG